MALIKCIECGREVSEFAESCPNCGCPVSMFKNTNRQNINTDNFSVILTSYGERKINIIAQIKKITGFDLTIAKNIVENLATIKVNCSAEEANQIKILLENEGATVNIVPYNPSHEKSMKYDDMSDFPITINNKTFMVSEIISFVIKCESNKAIDYIINKTGCSEKDAEEAFLDVKNMYKYKHSTYSKKNSTDSTIFSNSTEKSNKNIQNDKVETKHIPKCPTCQSTNIRKISTTSKVSNTVLFGLLGTKRHKIFHCNNCGYEW